MEKLSLKQRICRGILRLFGWTIVGEIPKEEKCILLGAPHTSILDFVVSWLYYSAMGGKGRCMVKKELFFPPLGWILRAMGGIPVDRRNPAALLRSILDEMERLPHFHLAIAPEGTRRPVKRWKSGFHFIARKTGIPVYLGFFDWGTRRVGCGPSIELTDDPSADMARIQQAYAEMHLTGRHPQNYTTG